MLKLYNLTMQSDVSQLLNTNLFLLPCKFKLLIFSLPKRQYAIAAIRFLSFYITIYFSNMH